MLPVATAAEKRLRFAWAHPPSDWFLGNWNHCMEPNSLFVEDVSETGLTVTVRWALMRESPDQIRDRLNRWLEQVERGSYRPSGGGGRRI